MTKHSLIRSALRTIQMATWNRTKAQSRTESSIVENFEIIYKRFNDENTEDFSVTDFCQLAGYALLEYENHNMQGPIAMALYQFAYLCIECTSGTSESQQEWYEKYINR